MWYYNPMTSTHSFKKDAALTINASSFSFWLRARFDYPMENTGLFRFRSLTKNSVPSTEVRWDNHLIGQESGLECIKIYKHYGKQSKITLRQYFQPYFFPSLHFGLGFPSSVLFLSLIHLLTFSSAQFHVGLGRCHYRKKEPVVNLSIQLNIGLPATNFYIGVPTTTLYFTTANTWY